VVSLLSALIYDEASRPIGGCGGASCYPSPRYRRFLPHTQSPQNCAVLGPFDVFNRAFPLSTPDLSKSMSGRQKLEAQLTENNIVKEVRMGRGGGGRGGTLLGTIISFTASSPSQELALLDGSNVVFKLLGPVLVKQELGEARATVGKRLDYITAEM
jgi:chaperonin cofactor prefoldin